MKIKMIISIIITCIIFSAVTVYYFIFMKKAVISEKSFNGISFVQIKKSDNDLLIISKYEITQKEYEAIMKSNPSTFKDNPDNPVETISENEIIDFCNEMSLACGLKPFYLYSDSTYTYTIDLSSDGFRIPTVSECAYALRGNSKTTYYWGNDIDDGYLWYKNNSGEKTHPVGGKKPNSFGLYDMCGNTFELCFKIEDGVFNYTIMGGNYLTQVGDCFTHETIDISSIDIKYNTVGIRLVKNDPSQEFLKMEKEPRICYAYSINGLVLRSGPGASSKQITLLPYGAFLKVQETGKTEMISDKTGEWLKVKWYPDANEKSAYIEGWCFSAFVTDNYPGFILPPGAAATEESNLAESYSYSMHSNLYAYPKEKLKNDKPEFYSRGLDHGYIIFNKTNKTVTIYNSYYVSSDDPDGLSGSRFQNEEKHGIYNFTDNKVFVKFNSIVTTSSKGDKITETIDDTEQYMLAEIDKYYLLLCAARPQDVRDAPIYWTNK
ncbi:MAG TPA: SUMF1/EgtB/PvdO family nonheme iron enzyme [Spirochaetota bacterium]|nr:SUMF1/EgtB/PvdO family nonheme iron enzyme [Spirochaetota bacterium]